MKKIYETKIKVVEPIRDKRDIQRIIDWFYRTKRRKYAVMFTLGVYSGLRISDLLKLKVRDVLNRDNITLREQKTGKYKLFPLQKRLQNLLNDFCKNRNPDEWLFTGRHSRKLDRSQMYRFLNQACKELNINVNAGTHTMRKTFGYHQYKQFHDIGRLQIMFNHYSPNVTRRYIGITQDEINECYLNFNLDPDYDIKLKIIESSRVKSRRVESYLNNYLKNGGQRHRDFALDILEILHHS